ncbi:MAG: hypothetical protein Q7R71_01095 [bacterium]|nr:hypothetical protein [bacterium]
MAKWKVVDVVENIKNLLLYPLMGLAILLMVLHKAVPMAQVYGLSLLNWAAYVIGVMGAILVALVVLVAFSRTKQKSIMF